MQEPLALLGLLVALAGIAALACAIVYTVAAAAIDFFRGDDE